MPTGRLAPRHGPRAGTGSCASSTSRQAAVVLDAAAMTVQARAKRFDRPVLLTPHAGEIAHLSGCDKDEVLADPLICAGPRRRTVRWPVDPDAGSRGRCRRASAAASVSAPAAAHLYRLRRAVGRLRCSQEPAARRRGATHHHRPHWPRMSQPDRTRPHPRVRSAGQGRAVDHEDPARQPGTRLVPPVTS